MTPPLILDTGALIAVIRRSRAVWVLLDEAQRSEREVLVPAATLAESVRGGPGDAMINRLVQRPGSQVTVHDERRARSAGHLLARASTADVVDALVVAEAIHQGGATIATSDPDDIADLASGNRNVTAVRI